MALSSVTVVYQCQSSAQLPTQRSVPSSPDRWIVTLLGLALIACFIIVWFFWLKNPRALPPASAAAAQEAMILVKGGYTPDVIVVKAAAGAAELSP